MKVLAPELLERQRFQEELERALESVADGGGRTVLVQGEAGIGKTALVQSFVAAQRGNVERVLSGACEALFTPRPLGPLHDVALETGGELLQLFSSGAPRPALFAAALAELRRGGLPMLVVFEDVHWADEATLDFLKFVGRRIATTRALFLVTYRDDEVGPRHPLRSVLGDLPRASVTRLELPALSKEAVAALARASGRALRELHAITGGNPFFVTEVLAAPASGELVPPTVRDAVLARASRLSAAGREVLELAALVPGKVERTLLEAVLASDEVAGALEECVSAGLLKSDGAQLAFRHELARRAIEETVEAPTVLHRSLLAALEAGPEVSAARLVYHAEAAGDGAAVLRLAPTAAEHAAGVGAHREAAAHYASALRHAASLAPAARGTLLEKRSYECYLTDQIEDALAARGDALLLWRELGEREREGACLRWASRLEWFLGRRADAERSAREAVSVLESAPPGRELALAISNRAQLAMLMDDVPSALVHGERAIRMAESLGDVEVLAHALNNVGTTRFIAGDAQGRAELERSLELARGAGLEEHVARAWTNLGSALVLRRDYAAARAFLDQGIEYCVERDLDSWTLYMRAWSARLALEVGEWERAAEEASAVLDHARAAPISRIPALAVLGSVRARRGDPGAALLLDEARALAWPTEEPQRILPVAAARAEAAWLAGEDERAIAEAEGGLARAPRADPWSRGELAAWIARAGGPREAAGEIAEPYALELANEGKVAAELWERLGRPYERALALASAGAEAELFAALELLRTLGAVPAQRLVERRLRALGARGIPRGARPSTLANPAGLTARELEILQLVARGLRNAQIARKLFVSPKTVDHHVSAILAKLGAKTRTEAGEKARVLGLL